MSLNESTKYKVLIGWSSGKDSAWVLHLLNQRENLEVVGLLTTFTEGYNRVSMHGVRKEIVEMQSRKSGIPLCPVFIPSTCSNEEYERKMAAALIKARNEGVTHIAFGDLFLEEIRQYRIKQLKNTGIEPLFPTWVGRTGTMALANKIILAGIKTKVVCVDPRQLDRSFVGRDWNQEFLNDLPKAVDPCGENGEFHTCCYSGPMFQEDIELVPGETVERDNFWYADFSLASVSSNA